MASTGAIKAGEAFVQVYLKDGVSGALKRLHSQLTAFGRAASEVGRPLLAAALPAAAGFGAALKVFSGFESQMSAVKAVTGATEAEFSKLVDKAKLLGATTTFSATEVAQGMQMLGMAGFDTEKILTGIPAVLNLAKAGAVELGVAADIASDIGGAFGMSADEISRIADVLAATATSSNTNIEGLGETFKYAAPLAKAAGQSIEETAAAAGLLGNSGVKASMAGTDLKNILGVLAKETEIAGVKTQDAAGNIRPMLDVMRELGVATRSMSKAERFTFFTSTFNERSAKSAIILADANDEIDRLRTVTNNATGAGDAMAQTMGDNLGGSFKSLLSAIESVAIAIGETLGPTIRTVTDFVTKLTRGFSEFAKENPGVVQAAAALTAGVLTLGIALTGLGLASQLAATSIGGLTTFAGAATGMMGTLTGAATLAASTIARLRVVLMGLGGTAVIAAILYLIGKMKELHDVQTQVADSSQQIRQTTANMNQTRRQAFQSRLADAGAIEDPAKRKAEFDAIEREYRDMVGGLDRMLAPMEGKFLQGEDKARFDALKAERSAWANLTQEIWTARSRAAKAQTDSSKEIVEEARKLIAANREARKHIDAIGKKRQLDAAPGHDDIRNFLIHAGNAGDHRNGGKLFEEFLTAKGASAGLAAHGAQRFAANDTTIYDLAVELAQRMHAEETAGQNRNEAAQRLADDLRLVQDAVLEKDLPGFSQIRDFLELADEADASIGQVSQFFEALGIGADDAEKFANSFKNFEQFGIGFTDLAKKAAAEIPKDPVAEVRRRRQQNLAVELGTSEGNRAILDALLGKDTSNPQTKAMQSTAKATEQTAKHTKDLLKESKNAVPVKLEDA